jgi:hypothetical protein
MQDNQISTQEENDFKSESYLVNEDRIDLQEMLKSMMFIPVGNNQDLVNDLKRLNDDR